MVVETVCTVVAPHQNKIKRLTLMIDTFTSFTYVKSYQAVEFMKRSHMTVF